MAGAQPLPARTPPATLVGVDEERLELPVAPGWVATYRYGHDGSGRRVIRELRVAPEGARVPEGGVTARLLRQVSTVPPLPPAPGPAQPRRGRRRRPAERAPARPGRRGRPDAFYALLALRYTVLLWGGSRRPIADLARSLGNGWGPTYVRDIIRTARQRGMLSPGHPGRPGGAITPEARDLLNREIAHRGKGRAGSDIGPLRWEDDDSLWLHELRISLATGASPFGTPPPGEE
jgi:hypothetical protein